ncbi:MAG: methionyl-tRNA formyltransferase [Candidatus Omnitrophota bacterium]|nr:methionyl-tRNA formyltransferase [Candidatus Omnitrophota bacterium]
MKIVFFGTGKLGLPVLKTLIESSHSLLAVVTQPDKKFGRGWNVLPQPMKAFIEKARPGIPVYQPEKVSDQKFIEDLKKIEADLFIVVDYGQILTKEILALPSKYCINLHPSLLPKYRGASPVNRAILNGDIETGNSIIIMNDKMDAGDILMKSFMKIGPEENAESLFERLSHNGKDLIIKVLDEIACGREHPKKQNEDEATYAPKLKKEDGKIDWSLSARDIHRKIRGLKPWPGAFTYLDGKILKILTADVIAFTDERYKPGQICVEKGLTVCCGKDAISVTKLQLEGKRKMNAREFLLGHKLNKDKQLG